MISDVEINNNLEQIETWFNSSTIPLQQLYYSKLGILELCGWVEEAMDSIILESKGRTVLDPALDEYIKNSVKRTYGFEYSNHFTKLLICIMGAKNLQNLENIADQEKLIKLKAELGNLKEPRNSNAHTFLKENMNIDAPSVTKSKFKTISEGLKEIEKKIKDLSY